LGHKYLLQNIRLEKSGTRKIPRTRSIPVSDIDNLIRDEASDRQAKTHQSAITNRVKFVRQVPSVIACVRESAQHWAHFILPKTNVTLLRVDIRRQRGPPTFIGPALPISAPRRYPLYLLTGKACRTLPVCDISCFSPRLCTTFYSFTKWLNLPVGAHSAC